MTILVSCAEPEPLVFRYQIAAAPGTLDPAGFGDAVSSGIKKRIFDGLVDIDPIMRTPVAALAESWDVSEDGLVYTFRLREAVFHHGRAIEAQDVRASWERFLAPGRDSETAFTFEPIVGVAEFRSGAEKHLRGVEILDSQTLRVRLRHPFAAFLYNLSHDSASVLPVEEAQRLGAEFARKPIGSGPFQVVSWDDDLVLKAFRGHHDPPKIDRLVYRTIPDPEEALRLYQAGELDLVSRVPGGRLESLRRSYGEDLRFSPSSNWFGFCYRCDRPPFHDARVRRAFAWAIDRDEIVRDLGELQHAASRSLLPQNTAGFDPTLLSAGFDPDKARALLREAGFESEAFPAVTFTTRTTPLDLRVAEHVREDLAAIGVEIDIEVLEFTDLLKARGEGTLAFFRYGWGGEYPNADSNLRPLFYSRGSDNRHGYSSSTFDRLLDEARLEEDPARSLQLSRDAEKVLLDDAPCVGLYQSTDALLLPARWLGVSMVDPDDLPIEQARLQN